MPRPDSWAETESDRAETKRKWLANCSTIEPFDFDEGILLETLRFREPVLSFPNETACDTACSATSVLDEAIASLRDERTLLADVLSRWQHDFFHQLDAHTRTFRDSAHQWRTEIDQLNTSQQHMYGEKDLASDEVKHATHDLLLPRYQVRAFSSDEGDFSGMFFDLATSSEFQEASTDRRDKPMVSPSSSSSDVSGDSFSHWHMLDKEHVLGTISCFLILLNTVFVGLKTHINLERAKDQHSNAISLTVIDGIFSVAFVVEVGGLFCLVSLLLFDSSNKKLFHCLESDFLFEGGFHYIFISHTPSKKRAIIQSLLCPKSAIVISDSCTGQVHILHRHPHRSADTQTQTRRS